MALPFKAPKINLKGKTFGISNTLAYPAIGAILLGGGYLAYQQMAGGKFNLGNLFGPPAKTSPKAVRVNFSVYPPTVKPFRKIRVQGSFEDANGVVATVPYAYYAIFESVPAGADFRAGRLLISKGVLGQNVGSFRQDLATDNFRTGAYVIYLSNAPINSDPLAGKQAELALSGGRPITLA